MSTNKSLKTPCVRVFCWDKFYAVYLVDNLIHAESVCEFRGLDEGFSGFGLQIWIEHAEISLGTNSDAKDPAR